jgi:hypothetical protein
MKVGTLVLGLALTAIAPSLSFCEEPPAVLTISRESIKEGRGPAHEKVETDWARAFRRAKFPYYWMAWTTMTGPSEVYFVQNYKSWADYEKADKMIETTSLKNESDMLESRDGELRASSRNMFLEYRKSLSYHGDQINMAKARYAVLTVYRLRLGRQAEFMEAAKKIFAAYEKSAYPYPVACYEVVSGAPAGTYHFVSFFDSLEPLDSIAKYGAAMASAMGKEEAEKLQKSAADLFTSIERIHLRLNPKMSYVSTATEEVDPSFWRPRVAAAPAAAPAAKPKDKTGQ